MKELYKTILFFYTIIVQKNIDNTKIYSIFKYIKK